LQQYIHFDFTVEAYFVPNMAEASAAAAIAANGDDAERAIKRRKLLDGSVAILPTDLELMGGDLHDAELNVELTKVTKQVLEATELKNTLDLANQAREIISTMKQNPYTIIPLRRESKLARFLLKAFPHEALDELDHRADEENEEECKLHPIEDAIRHEAVPFEVGWGRACVTFFRSGTLWSNCGWRYQGMAVGANIDVEANIGKTEKTNHWAVFYDERDAAETLFGRGAVNDLYEMDTDPMLDELEEMKMLREPDEHDDGDHKGRDASGITSFDVYLFAWKLPPQQPANARKPPTTAPPKDDDEL